jgi:hypothetical protein
LARNPAVTGQLPVGRSEVIQQLSARLSNDVILHQDRIGKGVVPIAESSDPLITAAGPSARLGREMSAADALEVALGSAGVAQQVERVGGSAGLGRRLRVSGGSVGHQQSDKETDECYERSAG